MDEFLIKSQVTPEMVVDVIEDIGFELEGKLIAKNKGGDTCPSGELVTECDTTKLLMNGVLESAYGLKLPSQILDVEPEIEVDGTKHIARMACDACAHQCRAAMRRTDDNKPDEGIRFMFDGGEEVNEARRPEIKPILMPNPPLLNRFNDSYYE